MIELTEKQRRELGSSPKPVAVIDPDTRQQFYLVPAEVFLLLQASLTDLDPREAYGAIDRAFSPDWDDPKMADYDQYEQHRP